MSATLLTPVRPIRDPSDEVNNALSVSHCLLPTSPNSCRTAAMRLVPPPAKPACPAEMLHSAGVEMANRRHD